MVSPDVGSVEDVVRALLEYLVDPLLPAKSSSRSTPSLSQQQSVAKQVFFFPPFGPCFEFCCFRALPLGFLPKKFWCLLVTRSCNFFLLYLAILSFHVEFCFFFVVLSKEDKSLIQC